MHVFRCDISVKDESVDTFVVLGLLLLSMLGVSYVSVPSIDLLGKVSVVSGLLDGFWMSVFDVCVGTTGLVGKYS